MIIKQQTSDSFGFKWGRTESYGSNAMLTRLNPGCWNAMDLRMWSPRVAYFAGRSEFWMRGAGAALRFSLDG